MAYDEKTAARAKAVRACEEETSGEVMHDGA